MNTERKSQKFMERQTINCFCAEDAEGTEMV